MTAGTRTSYAFDSRNTDVLSTARANQGRRKQPAGLRNCTTMVRKPHFGSSQAFRNRLKIDVKTPSKSVSSWTPSWIPKKSILDVRNLPRWPPKISEILQKSSKILAMTASAPRCLLEASKSLPRASRDPSKSRSRALKKRPRAFKKLHAASQEPSQTQKLTAPKGLPGRSPTPVLTGPCAA